MPHSTEAKPTQKKPKVSLLRQERQAKALRHNLQRRKAPHAVEQKEEG